MNIHSDMYKGIVTCTGMYVHSDMYKDIVTCTSIYICCDMYKRNSTVQCTIYCTPTLFDIIWLHHKINIMYTVVAVFCVLLINCFTTVMSSGSGKHLLSTAQQSWRVCCSL